MFEDKSEAELRMLTRLGNSLDPMQKKRSRIIKANTFGMLVLVMYLAMPLLASYLRQTENQRK
jgi:hypothetical protein